MDKNIFKAYDIRGRYPSEINKTTVRQISQKLAAFFKKGVVVAARDSRLSSPGIYQEVIAGLKINKKIKVFKLGTATTPLFYFCVYRLKATGGIMITASHNPKEWNGLKVAGKKAVMIPGRKILELMDNLL